MDKVLSPTALFLGILVQFPLAVRLWPLHPNPLEE